MLGRFVLWLPGSCLYLWTFEAETSRLACLCMLTAMDRLPSEDVKSLVDAIGHVVP